MLETTSAGLVSPDCPIGRRGKDVWDCRGIAVGRRDEDPEKATVGRTRPVFPDMADSARGSCWLDCSLEGRS